MSRHLLLASVLCLTACGCGRTSAVSDRRSAAGGQNGQGDATAESVECGDFVIGGPLRHGNLTVFPVLSKSPRSEDRFITLNEGLKSGTVQILEMGAGAATFRQANATVPDEANPADSSPGSSRAEDETGDDANAEPFDDGDDVNRLLVINRSTRPLYLMPGEIIVGGSQDRTIAAETVIAATGKPVPIDVYCVESGRWGLRDGSTSAAIFNEVADGLAGADELAAEANGGKFVALGGNLSKSSRLAVQDGAGQSKVWEEVARANDASGVTWSSGAFTANFVDKDVLGRMQPYLAALNDAVSRQERVVGAVVAINGKIETVDVFESTPLFRKLWPQILKSFALDALEASESEDADQPSTAAEAAEFLASVQRDQSGEPGKVEGGLVVSRHETKDAVSFSAGAAGGMMGGGMGIGGMGAPIHASGFAK